MRYFSMFSGIGGFERGIETAIQFLRTSNKVDGVGHKRIKSDINRGNGDGGWLHSICVGYSEIDKNAIQIYQKHFKEHKNYGDARRIVWEKVPDFEFLVAGFPCQSFSIAGKRGGFEDTRGTLFYEIARACRIKRPKLLLLENVKGLLSHDKGKTFGTILATLSELGYVLEWQVLNSKNFGVPQNRERVFIIGYLGRESFKQVFPIGESDSLPESQDRTKGRPSQAEVSTAIREPNMKADHTFVAKAISATSHKGVGNDGVTLIHNVYGGFGEKKHREFKDYAPTIRTPKGGGHLPMVKVHNLQTRSPDRPSLTKKYTCGSGKLYKKCCGVDGGSGHLSKQDGSTYCLDSTPQAVEVVEDFYPGRVRKSKDAPTLRGDRQGLKVLQNTITQATGNRAGKSKEYLSHCENVQKACGQIRRLTPTECERLQGFPDQWTEGVSDTQRYKCLGNAVTVNVITAIMVRLI